MELKFNSKKEKLPHFVAVVFLYLCKNSQNFLHKRFAGGEVFPSKFVAV